jgi:signal transduction histidine kinase
MLGTNTEDILLNLGLLIVMIFVGILLIRSVRKEISAREHIEALAADLEKANENQVALIHFITHQVKGFFTKSRDIFSMMLEGDAGEIPDKVKGFVRQGFDSDTKGVAMVQDVLTAANVRSGIIKYAMEPFDVQTLVSALVIEYKSMAEGKGLKLTYEVQDAAGIDGGNAQQASTYKITGDQEQLKNVFKNLIENSIKYTPAGTVAVSLTREDRPVAPGTGVSKIIFAVKDSGVGISSEDKKMLFTQGGRGKDSIKVNVESTGYGLYIAKGIVEAHHGTIRAESEGTAKGSQFYVELPVVA